MLKKTSVIAIMSSYTLCCPMLLSSLPFLKEDNDVMAINLLAPFIFIQVLPISLPSLLSCIIIVRLFILFIRPHLTPKEFLIQKHNVSIK